MHKAGEKFVIRFHDGQLRSHIQMCAEAAKRSMNAEILLRLEAFDRQSTQWNPSVGNLVKTPDGFGTIIDISFRDSEDRGIARVGLQAGYNDYLLSDLKPVFV